MQSSLPSDTPCPPRAPPPPPFPQLSYSELTENAAAFVPLDLAAMGGGRRGAFRHLAVDDARPYHTAAPCVAAPMLFLCPSPPPR